MVSLYSTVSLSVVRLMIMKFNEISEFKVDYFSWASIRRIIIIWCLGILIAIPPFLGIGHYGQNMVVVR